MPDPRVLLSLEDYRDELLALVAPLAAETVPLGDALGRTLAEAVTSRGDVPAFANSAMDGYAVRWEDLADLPDAPARPVRLEVLGDVPAGSGDDPALPSGTCVRIMTGAPLPSDADTVVPVELTDEGTTTVEVRERPRRGRGAHVRAAGDDVAAGDLVVEAGVVLTPRVLSAVAAAGHAEVRVARRPVLALASTGDELVAPGGELGRGQVYESNSTHLAATIAVHGGIARRCGVVADDVDTFVAALDAAAGADPPADLVVLTGGVSVGAYDVARIALQEHAEATFRHVRMQPGKPQGWARWRGRTPVLALPGNPLSAALSFEVLGRPMLERMLGRTAGAATGWAVADRGWTSPAGRRQLVPVALRTDDHGVVHATPAHRRGSASHMVTSLVGADALAVVPEETAEVREGDLLETRSLA